MEFEPVIVRPRSSRNDSLCSAFFPLLPSTELMSKDSIGDSLSYDAPLFSEAANEKSTNYTHAPRDLDDVINDEGHRQRSITKPSGMDISRRELWRVEDHDSASPVHISNWLIGFALPFEFRAGNRIQSALRSSPADCILCSYAVPGYRKECIGFPDR